MSHYLAPVIAASAEWLEQVYAAAASPLLAARARVQANQATMVAAWLRYPTIVDAELVGLVGPGGAARLDTLAAPWPAPEQSWRSWVDEAVVSWAACVLTEADIARAAVAAVLTTEHITGLTLDFRPLLDPDPLDARAAALLRHPDLLRPVASLYRDELHSRLRAADPERSPYR